MTSTLLVDGVLGKAVVYTGSSADESPLTDPRGQIARVQFHTDFPYDRVVATAVYSIVLPALNENATRVATTLLGAHGQAGRPFVFGSAKVTSYPSASTGTGLAVNASVPFPSTLIVDRDTSFFCRRVYLMADATSIYLHEKSQSAYSATPVQRYPALTLQVTAYITDDIA